MGKVVVDFVGLHLIDNSVDGKKTVAVIDAEKEGVKRICERIEVTLDLHTLKFRITGKIKSFSWPLDADGRFLAKGNIGFSATGGVRDVRKKRLSVQHKCGNFKLPSGFFDRGNRQGKHALVTIEAGCMDVFRFKGTKSVHTRVDFGNQETFEITGDENAFIQFDPSVDVAIEFRNTEMVSLNDCDWLWYMHATENACPGKPNPDDVPADVTEIGDDGVYPEPISLGCSNSNWP